LDNIKEIKRFRRGDLQVAAQANVQIDAQIGQKDHFRMETEFYRKIISVWRPDNESEVSGFVGRGYAFECLIELTGDQVLEFFADEVPVFFQE